VPAAATAETAARFTGMFTGEPESVRDVRHAVAACLRDHPALVDDATLIASELATNAVLHSHSAGGFFTVKVTISAGWCWIECTDDGGPWVLRGPGLADRMHGLALAETIAGQNNLDIEGDDDGRTIWVRLPLGSDAR
jgi:anti-sigma regulatory factor (Ser/Thr protein kinase)